MKLAVCIVSFGRADLLEKTLKTLDDTCPDDIWVGIVDNGSSGRVPAILKDYEDLFDYMNLCSKNEGKPKAHNQMAAEAAKEYGATHYLFCDSDLDFLPGWYETIIDRYSVLEQDLQVGVLSGYHYGTVYNKNKHDKYGAVEKRHPPGCCAMVSRSAYEAARGFDEKRIIRCVDTDFNRALVAKKYENFSVWPESLILHTGKGQRTFDAVSGEPIYLA